MLDASVIFLGRVHCEKIGGAHEKARVLSLWWAHLSVGAHEETEQLRQLRLICCWYHLIFSQDMAGISGSQQNIQEHIIGSAKLMNDSLHPMCFLQFRLQTVSTSVWAHRNAFLARFFYNGLSWFPFVAKSLDADVGVLEWRWVKQYLWLPWKTPGSS